MGPIKDKDKLGKFYDFKITDEKMGRLRLYSRAVALKHFRNAFIFGFVVEYLITNTRIYDNIVKRATVRRLESKQKEDQNLQERRSLKEKFTKIE